MSITQTPGDFHPQRLSQYVPAMRFAADVDCNSPVRMSLGTPALADTDGIMDGVTATDSAQTHTSADFATTFDGSATSLTTTAGMMDAPYGRNVTVLGSAGADHVVTIIGRDYLNQPMRENLTLSGTTKIIGKKSFKHVTNVNIATGAASDTCDVGWGDKLGLPYKTSQVLNEFADQTFVREISQDLVPIDVLVDATKYAAGTSLFVSSPVKGDVAGLRTVAQVQTSGAGALAVEIGGTAVTGLAVVIATGATVGTIDEDVTVAAGATTRVAKGGALEITGDGTPSAGELTATLFVKEVGLEAPDVTDPATATTGDTRGTFEAETTYDGSTEIVVDALFNSDLNSSGNGGLHGLAHFNG